MTDLDKLLQMDSVDNISDELLAAYIDGNTTAEENEMIQSSMPLEDLDDIKEIAQDSLFFEEQLHFYDGDYGYWELGIPPVLEYNSNEEELDITSPKYDNLFSQENHKNVQNKSKNIAPNPEEEKCETQEYEDYIDDDDYDDSMVEDN